MSHKYAIIADVHSNLEALQAVIEDARSNGVTGFLCLGDVVGYNANPKECIALIRDLGAVTICGNHDHYCSHFQSLEDFHPNAASVIAWTRRQLNIEEQSWLANLPYKKVVSGGITLVHSTLDEPERWGYVFDILDAGANFSYQATTLCFHGHTHVPLLFDKVRDDIIRADAETRTKIAFGHKYFVNVGSVGQPRDGNPNSSYVIYCTKTKEIEFRRVAYDIETAADKVRKAGLPEKLASRLEIGR